MRFDTLIRNGTVVTATDTYLATSASSTAESPPLAGSAD